MLSHNKTLAAQLYGELKSFFPNNAVEYFISYYDYYQPEAYVPSSDTYIEKDASINEDIDRLRLRATSSLMERDDVVIVSTVSAIYGLGDPVSYRERMVSLALGQRIARDDILRALVGIQYLRNDVAFDRGTFRVRGDTVEIFPAYEEQAVRIELWGDEIERISKIDPLTGETIATLERTAVYPAKHFITSRPTIERASRAIREELDGRLAELREAGQAAGGAAARAAHQLRPRDDGRDRHLRGHRELLAPSQRTRRPASARPASSTTSPTTTWWSSTSRTSRCRRCAACTTATARASSRWSTTDSGCRARSTTGRSCSTSSWRWRRGSSTCRRRRVSWSCSCPRAWSWSRSSVPPDCSIRCSRSAR